MFWEAIQELFDLADDVDDGLLRVLKEEQGVEYRPIAEMRLAPALNLSVVKQV